LPARSMGLPFFLLDVPVAGVGRHRTKPVPDDHDLDVIHAQRSWSGRLAERRWRPETMCPGMRLNFREGFMPATA